MKTQKIFARALTALTAILFGYSATASAVAAVPAIHNDFGVVAGIRSNSADSAVNGYSGSSKTGYSLGVIGFFDIGQTFQIRSGFLYSQHNYTLTASGVPDVDYNMSYVDIPVTATYRFAEYAGAFAGPVLSFLASKECKVSGATCSTGTNPQSMNLGLQFGATFKFAPQMGAEVYYELTPSEFWKDQLKNANAVGVNFLLTFE